MENITSSKSKRLALSIIKEVFLFSHICERLWKDTIKLRDNKTKKQKLKG